MVIQKEDFVQRLTECEIELLQETLFRAEIEMSPDASAKDCAERIGSELWKRTQTLWEKAVDPKSLDEIVEAYTERLNISTDGDAFQQLDQLLLALLPDNSVISLDEIPEDVRNEFARSPWIDRLSAGSGPLSLVTSYLSKLLAGQLHRIPLWILKLLPWIGPKIIFIRTAANIIARVTGPLGIAISLWAIYRQLGPKWDHALPLLLGAGIALRHQKAMAIIDV